MMMVTDAKDEEAEGFKAWARQCQHHFTQRVGLHGLDDSDDVAAAADVDDESDDNGDDIDGDDDGDDGWWRGGGLCWRKFDC